MHVIANRLAINQLRELRKLVTGLWYAKQFREAILHVVQMGPWVGTLLHLDSAINMKIFINPRHIHEDNDNHSMCLLRS